MYNLLRPGLSFSGVRGSVRPRPWRENERTFPRDECSSHRYYGAMSEPTVEEALERARQAQEDRIEAIRGLGQSRDALSRTRDDADRRMAELKSELDQFISEAEKKDRRAYQSAIKAGWSEAELRKIGYGTPDRKTKQRRSRRRESGDTPKQSVNTDQVNHDRDESASTSVSEVA